MKVLIEGKEYDLIQGMSKATLYTLFELKSKYGIGVKSMVAQAKKMDAITDPMDLLENEDSFRVFLAVIWLARKHAGEKLTFEEANNIPLDGIEVIHEEGDPGPDPKAPAASAPAAKRPPRTSSSKTSKPRSTKTSS